MVKKGVTSSDFVKRLEDPKTKGFGDMEVMQMTEDQFRKLAVTSRRVSNFTRALRKRGYTEFSNAWGTRIVLEANRKMSEVAGLLDKLQGGIDDREQAQINAMVRARGKKDLRYIA